MMFGAKNSLTSILFPKGMLRDPLRERKRQCVGRVSTCQKF